MDALKGGGERLFNAVEAARRIGVGRNRIYTMLNAGEIPSVKVGKHFRIQADDLQAWMDEDKCLLRVEDVAQRLRIGLSKTYALINAHEIPSVLSAGRYRVSIKDLEAWIVAKTAESANDSD